MNRNRVILAFLVASVTAVSGCTGTSPAEKAQSQADEARKDMMEKLQSQQIDIEVMAVYERDGNTVFSLRNTGRKSFTTGNITVTTGDDETGCKPVREVSAGSSADCQTGIEFPSQNTTEQFKVLYSGKEVTSYNCSITSEDAVAC